MHGIIVVPPGSTRRQDHVELGAGERLVFGREPDILTGRSHGLVVAHAGVSRLAGEITAVNTFWTLSNLNRRQTYVVENPEGAGEHIKLAPGRLDAPIPFEFARILVPAADELLALEVWAPRHDYLGSEPWAPHGATTVPAFCLDRTKRYFAVLVALCEPRLRDTPAHTALPTSEEIARRLRPGWSAAGRTAVQWNINYLAVKLRLRPPREGAEAGPRRNGTKESLVAVALRFDLVREEDLALLDDAAAIGETE
ncbi:FHA domain-containing protein [Embleya sp. NPDC005575]|uniref:FHA domain-containing protein n=1 Tax=Embleya sp. NPDC005575 TaxID=3156892 RepID=UPI00339E7110